MRLLTLAPHLSSGYGMDYEGLHISGEARDKMDTLDTAGLFEDGLALLLHTRQQMQDEYRKYSHGFRSSTPQYSQWINQDPIIQRIKTQKNTLDHESLEEVEEITHLSTTNDKHRESDEYIKGRVSEGTAASLQSENFRNSKQLSHKTNHNFQH